MTLPENYNSLIIQECTDLSMITQHINNTYILNNKYTYIHNNSTNTQHKYINTYIMFFYLLAVIVEQILVRNK